MTETKEVKPKTTKTSSIKVVKEESRSLATRILAVQTEVGKLTKDQAGYNNRYMYFDINQLVHQLLPILAKHGVTVMQPLTNIEGKPAIETIVTHDVNDSEMGVESMSYTFPMPENPDPQKVGSAITYYRRYALQSFFLLQAEDDDGAGGPIAAPTPKTTASPKPIKSGGLEDLSGQPIAEYIKRFGTKPSTVNQHKFFFGLVDDLGGDQDKSKDKLKKDAGVEHLAEVPMAYVSKAIDDMKVKVLEKQPDGDEYGSPPSIDYND